MHFTVYIYSAKSPATELIPFRCPRCARIVFRHNASEMQLTNAYGSGFKSLKPGDRDDQGVPVFVEYKCHSCKSIFNILFQ